LLAEGFAANPTTLKALQQFCRLSIAEAAALCGVSSRTFRRWRTEGNAAPAALRLLAILAGYVPWDGWQGWEVHRGCLFPPGFRRSGISPGDFQAVVFWRQLVTAQREKLAKLSSQVAALEAELGWPAGPAVPADRLAVVVSLATPELQEEGPDQSGHSEPAAVASERVRAAG
jgi:hypothetical protein